MNTTGAISASRKIWPKQLRISAKVRLLSCDSQMPTHLKRFQILHQVLFFLIRKLQTEDGVVVVDYIEQRCQVPIVIEPAFRMGPQTFQR
jgi:hypothetical protein